MPCAGAESESPLQGSPRRPWPLILGLLLLCVALFAISPEPRSHLAADVVALAASLLAVIPGFTHRIEPILQKLRRPSTRAKAIIAVLLFVASNQYFLFSAQHAGRPLVPVFHDEYMY